MRPSAIESYKNGFKRQFPIWMHQILLYTNPKIRNTYKYYISIMYTEAAKNIALTTSFGNKNSYGYYKYCKYYLLMNIHHDAVSGWLMLASFFYRTKQYDKAIYLNIKYVNIQLYNFKCVFFWEKFLSDMESYALWMYVF